MSSKEKELTKDKGTEVAEVDDDFLEAAAGDGYQHMTSEDFLQAFIKILQPLSPQCVKGKEEYMNDAEPGMWYNQGTGELIGDKHNKLKVIPVYFKHEWLEWKPNRGGFQGKHDPESFAVDKSDFSKWIRPDNGNEISDTYTFFCFLPDYPEAGLVLMSFNSTNIKPAKSWNSLISSTKLPSGAQAPFYSSVWELGVSKREDNENTWYTMGVKKANAERLDYITKDQYIQFIKPLVEMARTTEVDYEKGRDNLAGDDSVETIAETAKQY